MSKPKALQLLIIICTISILHIKELKAKTEVFFSTEGETKEAVIQFINSAESSLDIAAFIFTSGDIAESLLTAKKRGVKTRIILDYKQKQNRDPVLQFIKDEGFGLKFVKGNIGGFMHHTFAIRDNKAVITGSYNWTDHSSKYNYENVVLVDEQKVVEKYLDEFNSILKNSKPMEGETGPSNSKPTVKSPNNTNEPTVDGNIKENVLNTKEENRTLPDNPDTDYLNITFEEFDKIFGKESDLNKSDRNSLWEEKFKGKYIKWEGRVIYRGVSLYDWNKVGIAQNSGKEADIQLKFHYSARYTVTSLKIGSTITYTGKLTSLKGMGSTYKITDCNVVSMKENSD